MRGRASLAGGPRRRSRGARRGGLRPSTLSRSRSRDAGEGPARRPGGRRRSRSRGLPLRRAAHASAARAALLPPADVGPRSHFGSAVRRHPGSPGLGAGDRRAGAIEPLRPAPRSHTRVVPLPPPVPGEPSRGARASRRPDRLGRSIAGRRGGTSGRGRPRRCSTRWPGRRCAERPARGAVGGRADPRRSPGHGSPLAGRLPGRRHRRLGAAGRDRCLGLRPVGEKDRARRYVTVAEGAPWRGLGPLGEPSPEAAVALIRAVFGWEGVSRMRADALTARRLIPAGHPAREVAALAVGCSLMLLGRTADAVPSLEEASALGEARPLASILARGVLAQIALEGAGLTRPRPAPERGSRSSAGLVSGRTPPAPPSAPPRASAPAAVTSHGRASISSRGDRSSRGWRRHRGCRSGRARCSAGSRSRSAISNWRDRCWTRLDGGSPATRTPASCPDCSSGRSGRSRRPRAAAACSASRSPPPSAGAGAAAHLSPAEIGEALHISRNTVKAHLKAIYRKLEVTRRSDAIERARRLGLLDPLG